MPSVLLDTNVASFLFPFKDRPEREAYRRHLERRQLCLSFQSVGELWRLAVKNRWGEERRKPLHDFLRLFTVVPADFELAKYWAEVVTRSERLGWRLETADAWIVATALRHDLPLVTHDKDMLPVGQLGIQVITELPAP